MLKSQLDQIHGELDFEEHIETALERAAALPAASRHTDEEGRKYCQKVSGPVGWLVGCLAGSKSGDQTL